MGEKDTGRDEFDTEVVRTFDKDQMKCEVKITTPGSQATCHRCYTRIEDDYQEAGL